jgi:hypothetical protein
MRASSCCFDGCLLTGAVRAVGVIVVVVVEAGVGVTDCSALPIAGIEVIDDNGTRDTGCVAATSLASALPVDDAADDCDVFADDGVTGTGAVRAGGPLSSACKLATRTHDHARATPSSHSITFS